MYNIDMAGGNNPQLPTKPKRGLMTVETPDPVIEWNTKVETELGEQKVDRFYKKVDATLKIHDPEKYGAERA